eukprot:TRINITY_DN39830_c0_g1_i1.p1 TRINITY_DN39830_c0_g1~~TRINITY_DN39830_c0_g1_i1.p1  ORF type:complete len:368 (-),score=62.72 TRINITY_DN39830_c0_g1_i1:254-1357(-)
MDLYKDDFADDDWSRPGRGEGLADEYNELSLFAGVDPNDLQQGYLGDCWLISAFAALAEFPDDLMAVFDRKALSDDGKYVITLYSYEDGQKIPIEIDDRLPTTGDGNPTNCWLSHSAEIWPCLLEKAFAKYSGGYKELDGGSSDFAFGALTGCTDLASYYRNDDTDESDWSISPYEYTSNDIQHASEFYEVSGSMSHSEMFAALAEFDQKNYLLCCGSNCGSDKDKNSSGVVQGHAYSLITVKQNVAGSGYDLLCLRNPWGCDEWTGEWSDHSHMWDDHPEVRKECGQTVDEDGIFWISWEHFCENYDTIYVCKKTMSSSSRGKSTLEVNKRDIALGKLEDRPHKVSPGIDNNRVKNEKTLFGCLTC